MSKPNKYIIGTYQKVKIYIPYEERTSENNIVVEMDGKYYMATAKETDVRVVINYMKSKEVLK